MKMRPDGNPIRGILIGLLLGMLLWFSGCRMLGESFIALHDSMDEAFGETNTVQEVVK